MTHLMKMLAEKRLRHTVVQWHTQDGIDEMFCKDKGSLIQRVSHRLLKEEGITLMVARWKPLEMDWDYATTWMVRDGWFQWPIRILWRISLACFYLWMGSRYAIKALKGPDIKGPQRHA